jgi:hypothetical protein
MQSGPTGEDVRDMHVLAVAKVAERADIITIFNLDLSLLVQSFKRTNIRNRAMIGHIGRNAQGL